MQVDGNEATVATFLSAWDRGDAEEERQDIYLVTLSNEIGGKRRNGKKWEIKYRVESDADTTAERYEKVKYGKKPRIAAYSTEIRSDLAKFNLTEDIGWTENEKLVKMSKRRSFYNFSPRLGNVVECCHVSVDTEGDTPPSRWLSVSIEGRELDSIRQELLAAQYDHLFRLLTSSRSRSTVLLGGYPTFLNHLEGRGAGASGGTAVEEVATWRETR